MEFSWNVVQMDRLTSDGFVVTVHYSVNAIDGEYRASTYGEVNYTQESKSYKPYIQLTENEVIGWIQNSLNKDAVEIGLASQIQKQKNPIQETGLPWSAKNKDFEGVA